MSDTFAKEVEQEILRGHSDLGQRRIIMLIRLLLLIVIGVMITVGLALNNVAVPWLFGLVVVFSLIWLSHAIVIHGCKKE